MTKVGEEEERERPRGGKEVGGESKRKGGVGGGDLEKSITECQRLAQRFNNWGGGTSSTPEEYNTPGLDGRIIQN